MIFIDLMGGLGNQLFQIFTVLAYEYQNGNQAVFPYSTYLGEAHTGTTVRLTYWENLFRQIRHKTTVSSINVTKANEEKRKWICYREPGFSYTPIPTGVQFDFQIHGYFQSWKYFQSHAFQIVKDLDLANIQNNVLERFSYQKDPQHRISMHFRLGDYKFKQAHHPVMSLDYYQTALGKCLADLGDDPRSYTVLYFCEQEDEEFVLRERIAPLQATYPAVTFHPAGHVAADWEQLMLMSACRHHILPNSSFSWWGAYLAELLQLSCGYEKHKRVYYPSKWFGPAMASVSTEDLCPPYWNRVLVS